MRFALMVLLAALPLSAQYPTQAGNVGFSPQAPLVATDGSKLSTSLVLSPYAFGAKCDAVWTNGTNTLTGTDDRAAFRAMLAQAVSLHYPIKIPGTCRVDAPGGVITNVAVSGNVATVTMANKLVPGDRVTPICLSAVPDLNGVPLDVTSATSTQFTAAFQHANVSSIAEPGGTTTHGRGAWSPLGCPAGSLAYGVSPALQINSPGVDISGAGGGAIFGVGVGPMFQWGTDKAVQITGANSDSSGVVTVTFAAMPNGVTFTPQASITLTGTGTALDDTYHTTVSSTATSVVISGSATSHPSLTATQGTLHTPFTNFDADGPQGYKVADLTVTNYSRAGGITGAIDAQFNYWVPGTAGFVDWRGGNGIIDHDTVSGVEYGFWGLASDFTELTSFKTANTRKAIFIGPNSTPFTVTNMDDFDSWRSAEIDGNSGQGVRFIGGHAAGGKDGSDTFAIVNHMYDSTGPGGGGLPTSSLLIFNMDFEKGGASACSHTPSAFIGIDSDADASTTTTDITLFGVSMVNSGSALPSCTVPYLTETGAGTGVIIHLNSPTPNPTITAFNHNLTTGSPRVMTDANDQINNLIPLSADSGSGASLVYRPTDLLHINNPTFTGTLTGSKISIQGDDTVNDNFINIGAVSGSAGYFLFQNQGSPIGRAILGMPAGLSGAPLGGSGASSSWNSIQGFNANLNNGGKFSMQCFTSSTPTLNTSNGYLFCGTDHRIHWYGDDYSNNEIAYTSDLAGAANTAVAAALSGTISPTAVNASVDVKTPLVLSPAAADIEIRMGDAAGANGINLTDSTGSLQQRFYSDGHAYIGKYVWDNYTISNIGTAVASASTIALTAGITHITGTAAIATITPPPGMNSTVGGCLTIIADAASSTTTAGNIFAATTFAAGSVHQACYDGSKFYIQ